MDDKKQDFKNNATKIYRALLGLYTLIGILACFVIYTVIDPTYSAFRAKSESTELSPLLEEGNYDDIENGIHLRTGLKDGIGLMQTVNNCTTCHSAKLLTQNRMDATRWAATIDWMQETQNLSDLGENEAIIINYLVTNYPIKKKGRRAALENIQWYELEN